ncbi:Na+/H+ antiporter NhaC family protein [Alteribacter natronophilus]|uniref:Na+/H+ antiporter NhaC family protein n=1 Tax=Alteribacter natronophilus TaxID=2583810 RepID=UPI0014874D5C|nr:Na+/H+ antiporter NhaC family protein [Alteribacter natronophilus]
MKRTFTLIEIIMIFAVTLAFLMGAIATGFSLALAMLPGVTALILLCRKKGISWTNLGRAAVTGISRNRNVAWLLAFIGLILPTWYMAGTIDDLNALFLTFISPEYFLTVAFLVTGLMSFTVGSSVGSLSIVGIPLMSAGLTLGLPAPLVAGALVSGSFVGDRSSPLSSSFQLLAFSVELKVQEHLRSITPTMIVTVTLTAMLFFLADMITAADGTAGVAGPGALEWNSLLLSLIPPVLLLVLIFTGKDMKTCFTAGILAGGAILLYRGTAVQMWVEGAVTGAGGLNGLIGMLPFVLFILIVGAYCQIIEETGMLQPFIERVFHDTSNLTKNTAQTVGVAAGVSLISPNQSFPILLAGRSLLPHWRTHFHRRELSRTLADSTVVFAGLVPWSLLAILCSTIVGVPVIAYLPFAAFLWLAPIVTIVFSWVKSKQSPRLETAESRSS